MAWSRPSRVDVVPSPNIWHWPEIYELENRALDLPHAEEASKTVLSLPVHPLLDEASLDRICARVRDALK